MICGIVRRTTKVGKIAFAVTFRFPDFTGLSLKTAPVKINLQLTKSVDICYDPKDGLLPSREPLYVFCSLL